MFFLYIIITINSKSGKYKVYTKVYLSELKIYYMYSQSNTEIKQFKVKADKMKIEQTVITKKTAKYINYVCV